MLVLKRRCGETLVIGSDVRVTVLQVRGNQVSIGINAPQSTTVHREEVYERIQREESRKPAA
jgi:carbon storage regulator